MLPLQSDWEDFYDELDNIDFTGKKVAYFGEGDSVGYPDTFQDAMGMLEEKIDCASAKCGINCYIFPSPRF